MCFLRQPLVFQFMFTVPSTVTAEKHLAPLSIHPSGIYVFWKEISNPSLLWVKQSQISQLFLICEIVELLHHLHGCTLDFLQYVHIDLALKSPELERVLQVWPHQC